MMSDAGRNNTNTPPVSLKDLLKCDLDLKTAELPFILVSTLIVNTLAFFVLQRMRNACENIDHTLVCILNVNDLLTTVVCVITWISGWASCGRFLLNTVACSFFGWLTSALVVWSAFILVIMASCRYLSLVKPFFYRVNVTRRRVVTASLVSLAISCLIFTFPMTGWGQPFHFYYENHICAADFAPGGSTVAQRAFISSVGVIGCLTVMHVLVCNFFIIKTLRQRATIQDSSIATITLSHTSTLGPSGKVLPTGRQAKKAMFERVSLVVSLVYVLCYSPFAIRLLVDAVEDRDHQDNLAHSVTMAMLFMSPFFNPIIYGAFNRHFRGTLLQLFRFRREQRQTSVVSE